ncbi:MAG: DegT/DnrJ/EryC1/StrS family aminotransferase [Paludibacteraceae bacterium]|nr:DegT/DnrJ/EryC1/StrS family aminotransferase [Paludibacteraceae bacterium]
MRKIEMVDLKSQYHNIKTDVDAAIQEVLDSTIFVKGGKVEAFREHFASYLNVKHVIPVGNGTDALMISLLALGLKPGDEVIAPSFTFVATAEVVALLGLKLVLVDVDPDTFCISLQDIENAITENTKVIIPVHLFGQNADMESILRLAREHNIYVVEDACQSIGSYYTFSNGEKYHSGCIGDIGCTSFFPSKNLGCYGDGGAIFTNNDELAEKMHSIANHGMKTRYHYERVGVNSRLDTIQAAILDVKLSHLDGYISSRVAASRYYHEHLKEIDWLRLPIVGAQTTHSYHQFTVIVDNYNRNELQAYLKERAIPTMVYYPKPLHLQDAYRKEECKELPVSEFLSEKVLSLPMHTELDEEQLAYIVESIKSFPASINQ